MALTVAQLRARINRQLSMLGFDSSANADAQTDILHDAVRGFVSRMDHPVISASMAITADDDGPYAIPTTIRKLQDIRDADGDSVRYTRDTTANTITLDVASTAAATYTAYGTPKEVVTNLDTIVAAISEDYLPVLAAYCLAYAKLYAMDQDAPNALKLAHELAGLERKSANRLLDLDGVPVQSLDVQGKRLGDSSNSEGFDADIDDEFASDL